MAARLARECAVARKQLDRAGGLMVSAFGTHFGPRLAAPGCRGGDWHDRVDFKTSLRADALEHTEPPEVHQPHYSC